MFLIVGLGNFLLPSTRHNVGMMAVEYICKKLEIPLLNESKLGSLVGLTNLSGLMTTDKIVEGNSLVEKAAFLKPKGFMNLSGIPVSKAMKHYKIPISKLIVIHDDLDRKLGKISVKNGGSAQGHNGLKSIIQYLGNPNFKRIRIGIDRPDEQSEVSDYVLSAFTKQELDIILEQVFPKVSELVNELVAK